MRSYSIALVLSSLLLAGCSLPTPSNLEGPIVAGKVKLGQELDAMLRGSIAWICDDLPQKTIRRNFNTEAKRGAHALFCNQMGR